MSLYEVLGVAPDADPTEVRRAYLDLARRHHPDRHGGDPDRMRLVNDAWATLGDPTLRREYDLAQGRPRPGAARPPWTGFDHEAADRADLDDDRPLGGGAPAPSWLPLIPVGLFAASLGIGMLGMLLRLPALFGVSVLTFSLSCLSFLAVPLVGLYASRRPTHGGRPSRRR